MTLYYMKIRTILIILFVILLPFILNLWNGYLKPAQSGKFKELDCSTISNSLNPYVNDIIHIAQNHGNNLLQVQLKVTRSLGVQLRKNYHKYSN